MEKFGGGIPLFFFIIALLIISIFCIRFIFLADKFVKERDLGDDAGALARIIGVFQLPYIIYGLLMIFVFDNGFIGANIYFGLLAMTFAGVFIVTLSQNVLHIPRKYGNDNGKMQPIIASSIGFISTMVVFFYNPHLI